jgi:hypothetical protein
MAIMAAGSLRTALGAKLGDRGHLIMSGGVSIFYADVPRGAALCLLEPPTISS